MREKRQLQAKLENLEQVLKVGPSCTVTTLLQPQQGGGGEVAKGSEHFKIQGTRGHIHCLWYKCDSGRPCFWKPRLRGPSLRLLNRAEPYAMLMNHSVDHRQPYWFFGHLLLFWCGPHSHRSDQVALWGQSRFTWRLARSVCSLIEI